MKEQDFIKQLIDLYEEYHSEVSIEKRYNLGDGETFEHFMVWLILRRNQ